MKVGTDAVLLGAWSDVQHARQILEIGTGSGVIALMLAQRSSPAAHIDAVEIEESDASQASENVRNSPWQKKISVHHKAIQDYRPAHAYDMIVSNPPFFSNGLLPPAQKRKTARHDGTLTHEALTHHALQLMTSNGKFCVILPYTEGISFREMALGKGLHCSRQLAFYSRREKPQERWLFEFILHRSATKNEKLVLYNQAGEWSHEYKALTKAFYL